ncbi:MAG: hypothetical protein KKE11_01120 [Gammaproteobacteria bacterium]|nr:hypothetical protein [Gammaproteobacteria bacterium]
MNTRKEKFAKDLFYYVSDISQNHLSDHESRDSKFSNVMGVCQKDLWMIIRKIVTALPDYIFLKQLSELHNEVLEYVAREYILFQCQENIDDPSFANNLANFIYEVINTINKNYNYH